MVMVMRTGTENGPGDPGPGLVHVTLLCHVAVEPAALTKASVTNEPLRLARGSGDELDPQ
jgi:hypothetical protein